MTMTTEETTAFGEVLAALMEIRGQEPTRENMAALAEESGLAATRLLRRVEGENAAFPGHMRGVAEALDLTEREKTILALSCALERGHAGDVYAEVFEQILTHLDFVACLDETEHGGSAASKRIREVLIPFCDARAKEARHPVE